MVNVAQDLAVQSYCFRGFKTNEEVIEQVKRIGLSRVELCGCHADFGNEKAFDAVVSLYEKAGVRIVSIGVQGFSNNEAVETKWFEFVKRAGAKVISADFAPGNVPDCCRTAVKLAEKYDVNIGIHNHGGGHWLGSPQMLGHVLSHTSPRIGMMLDTAWMIDSGGDPCAFAEQFAGRLYGVHIKDFVYDRARRPQDVVVGKGNLNLPKLVTLLKEKGPAGCCPILEYEGDVANPAPALTECVKAVRAVA